MERAMIVAARAISAVGATAMLVQSVPSPADPVAAIVALAGKLSVDVALLGGLWWMAKKYDALLIAKDAAVAAKDEQLSKKDDQVVVMATKVTETMALVMEAVKELRTTVAGLKLEYAELPCSIREDGRRQRT